MNDALKTLSALFLLVGATTACQAAGFDFAMPASQLEVPIDFHLPNFIIPPPPPVIEPGPIFVPPCIQRLEQRSDGTYAQGCA